jgi:hypothetical protein
MQQQQQQQRRHQPCLLVTVTRNLFYAHSFCIVITYHCMLSLIRGIEGRQRSSAGYHGAPYVADGERAARVSALLLAFHVSYYIPADTSSPTLSPPLSAPARTSRSQIGKLALLFSIIIYYIHYPFYQTSSAPLSKTSK